MMQNKINKKRGFTQLVDFGDAISSRTEGASPKFTTGFTLVEMLVAISIFSVSILGLMSVLASGIAGANFAKQKVTATYLAQEGIEYLRNKRDNYMLFPNNNKSFSDFKSELLPKCVSGGEGCGFDPYLDPLSSPLFPCGTDASNCKLYINSDQGYDPYFSGISSGFTRKIWADGTGLGTDEVKIFSEVSWGSDRKSVV